MAKQTVGSFYSAMLGLAAFSVTLAVLPALPLLAHQAGAGDLALGAIVAASVLVGLILRWSGLGFTRGWASSQAWLIATAILFTAPLFYLLPLSPLALGLVRVYHGLGTTGFTLLAAGHGTNDPRAGRGDATAVLAGLALAPLAGSVLLAFADERFVYVLSAVAGLAALAGALAMRRALPSSAPSGCASSLSQVWHNRPTRFGLIALVVQYGMAGTLAAFLPVYAQSVSMHIFAVGLAFGLLVGMRNLGSPVEAWLANRYGYKQAFSVGLYLSAFSMIVFPATSSPLMALAMALVFGLGLGVSLAALKYFLGSVRAEEGSAALSFLQEAGLAIGSLLVGLVLQFTGGEYWLGFVLIASLVVVLAFIFNITAPEIRLTAGKRK